MRVLAVLCAAAMLVGIAAAAPRLSFQPPALLPVTEEYGVGYRAVTEQASAGPGTPGVGAATLDGGKTWHALPASPGLRLPAMAAVTPTTLNGLPAVRDFGSVAAVKDKMAKYRSFSSPTATYLTLDAALQWNATTAGPSVTISGFPFDVTCGDPAHPGLFGCPLRLSGVGQAALTDGSLVQSAIIWSPALANPSSAQLHNTSTSVVSIKSTDGGLSWVYQSVIANASALPFSQEGPNENDVVLGGDNKTVVCVVRLDAGDGQVSHPYVPYYISRSTDGGATWSFPQALPKGVGSARPRLMRLWSAAANGTVLVLAGGRSGPTNRDVIMWVSSDGIGNRWEAYSVSYWHNVLETNPALRFTPAINASTARESTSYTSLVRHASVCIVIQLATDPIV